jgi:hypothetical protein
MIEGLFFPVCAFAAAILSIALRSLKPGWSLRRRVFVAALPIPAVILAFCAYLAISVVTTPRAQCGIDACGMAMMAAMAVAAGALGVYVIGILAAGLAEWMLRKK